MNKYSRMAVLSFVLLAISTFSCKPENKKDSSIKFQQYYVEGELLYTTHCSNCHQKNGTGLGLVYPPLNTSDFMQQHFDEVVCLIKNGRSGELIVNGKSFNQPMPGIPSLTELEIAEITTYIYNSWEHNRGLVEVSVVNASLQQCTAAVH